MMALKENDTNYPQPPHSRRRRTFLGSRPHTESGFPSVALLIYGGTALCSLFLHFFVAYFFFGKK